MGGLLALHIAEPCNPIWRDVGNCLVQNLRGDGSSDSSQADSAESVETPEPENEAMPSSEPDPAPEGEASGDYALSCGSGGCFQDGTPVYPIEGGEACVSGGVLGTWNQEPQGATAMNFYCSPIDNAPTDASSKLAVDASRPVACIESECRQGTGSVVAPSENEACASDGVFGTWITVEYVSAGQGATWRCLGD
jgi:hypothetical protein